MQRGFKVVLVGTCIVAVGAGGYGAFNVVHGVTESSKVPGPEATAQSTTPPSAAAATKAANGFLASWSAGPAHYQGAASDTNDPASAGEALQSYHDGLKLTSVHFSDVAAAPEAPAAPDPTATHVSFTVTARVAGGTWSYPGGLDVIQSNSGVASVQWAPSVLFPALKDGQLLAAGALPAGSSDITVTDYHGAPLTAAKYPSLADILSQLKTRFAGKAEGGGAGRGVEVTDAEGSHVSTVKTFAKAKPAKLKTTLDAGLQAAAEMAARDPKIASAPSGVVAIDHSNGYVKAVAYSGDEGDIAINGWTPPGSTMKIITAGALIDQAGLGPGTAAPCQSSILVNGQVFHNVDDEHAAGATLADAFKMSCNTAFIKLVDNAWGKSPQGFTAVGDEARDVFGLGSWSIGVATKDPQVLDPTNGDRNLRAGDAIGQGDVAASPLVMASVAATVRNAGFKQPILIPGLDQTPAKKPISERTAADLQQMMRATALGGTAAPRVADLPGVGAKTGTAEVNGGNSTNGWFTAYNDHIAVAAEVIGGKTGANSAGYLVRDMLQADQ